MTPIPPTSSDHARHDRLLVVRYLDLDDDLLPAEVELARGLLATCSDCAALATELQLISDATSQMALPARPRDFRLSAEQAASLRATGFGGFVERVAAAFRLEFLRPLAGAAVAIGLLLAVVGSLPLIGPSAASAPAPIADSGQSGVAAPVTSAASVTVAAPATASPLGIDASVAELPTAAPAAASALPPFAAPTNAPLQPQATVGAAGDMPPAATPKELGRTPTAAPAAGTPSFGSAAASAGNYTADGPGGTPQGAPVAAPPERGSGGAVTAGDESQEAIPPLAVLGVLLFMVGLVVIGLTVLARRIGRTQS